MYIYVYIYPTGVYTPTQLSQTEDLGEGVTAFWQRTEGADPKADHLWFRLFSGEVYDE